MRGFRVTIALFLIANPAGFIRAQDCFDDKKLGHWTAQHAPQRPALVYVWSPRMVYSVHNLPTAARAAARAGMAFIALHDSRLPRQEWQQALAALQADANQNTDANTDVNDDAARAAWRSQPLCAPTLLEREAFRHFPSAFVLSARGLHGHAIVGAMPLAAWQQSLANRLGSEILAP